MATTITTLITVWALFYMTYRNLNKLENKIDRLTDNLTKFEEREK